MANVEFGERRFSWSPHLLHRWGWWGCMSLLLVSVFLIVADTAVSPKSSAWTILGVVAFVPLWSSFLIGDLRARRQIRKAMSRAPTEKPTE
jgi:hypothetical protein